MAKKQTRRSVSLNRQAYDALAEAAARAGVSQSELVCEALRAHGVDILATKHTALEHVEKAVERRRVELDEWSRWRKQLTKPVTATRLIKSERLNPGPIRRALGDEIADACGEPRWRERVA